MEYLIYRLKCWIYWHKHTCCSEVQQRCNRCGYYEKWKAEQREGNEDNKTSE